MTHRRKNHRCLREDRSSGSGAWALVEDFDRGLFGRQSKSHYSSDHRENRNMCFLTVFLTGGRRSGMYGPALSVDDKSPRHSLSLVKDSKFWGCGRMRGQPEVAHPRCHLETAQHASRVRNSSVWQVSNPPCQLPSFGLFSAAWRWSFPIGGPVRNVARIKLGYYPLPLAEGLRLRKLLAFEDGASAADPCAGTGAALHQLTEGADVDKHGVELDAGRAAQSVASGITTIHHLAGIRAETGARSKCDDSRGTADR